MSDYGFELWEVVEFAGWSIMWWITRGVRCLETYCCKNALEDVGGTGWGVEDTSWYVSWVWGC